jgi:acyl-coenzyme A synthetase/AMP-(fatty) acid ligase
LTNCLLQHPDVAETATVGVPDQIYIDRYISGEVPVGFVVSRPGRQPAENELLEHRRIKLAAFKVPAAVVIVEAIPKNANGKEDRSALAALWERRRSSG